MLMVTIDNLIVLALYVGVLLLCRMVFEYPKFPLYLFLCGVVCLVGAPGFVIGLISAIMVPVTTIGKNVNPFETEDNDIVFRQWVRRIIEWFKNSKLRKFLLK